jgi:hypothetical protein
MEQIGDHVGGLSYFVEMGCVIKAAVQTHDYRRPGNKLLAPGIHLLTKLLDLLLQIADRRHLEVEPRRLRTQCPRFNTDREFAQLSPLSETAASLSARAPSLLLAAIGPLTDNKTTLERSAVGEGREIPWPGGACGLGCGLASV